MFEHCFAAALLLATPAAAPAHHIDVAGISARYTRTVDADGVVHYRGHEHGSRRPFHLRVKKNGWVSGRVDGTPVRFRVAQGRSGL